MDKSAKVILFNHSERLIGINAIAGLSRLPQVTIPIKNSTLPIGISFLAGQNQDVYLLALLCNNIES